jgi:hypothetical protein
MEKFVCGFLLGQIQFGIPNKFDIFRCQQIFEILFDLVQMGLNIITLPKTIDKEVAMTDITFGYDTALSIATEAIDRSIPLPTAIIALLSSKSWAIRPAGWDLAPALPVGPTLSLFPRSITISNWWPMPSINVCNGGATSAL